MGVWRRFALAVFCVATGTAEAAEAVAPASSPVASSTTAPLAPVLPPNSTEARLQAAVDAAKPSVGSKSYTGEADDLAAAKAFYSQRNYLPIWVTGPALNPRGGLVIAELGRADDWGLKAADFAIPAIKDGAIADATAIAETELAITHAALKYARFARGGRIPDPGNQLSGFIDRKPQIIPPQNILEQLASATPSDEVLRGFHPQHAQFLGLRKAYLAARANDGLSASLRLPPGPVLVPGISHPNVALMRKRLDVPTPSAAADIASPEQIYDPALVAAVKVFQTKSGLRPDGFAGEKTRLALNGEGKSTIPSLLANMEQWRWMPATLGDTFVQVNIPEYEMRLVKDGRVVHNERVVTGKLETATPAFSAEMQTIVFQPKWGVPDSIKVNELLPRLQDGRGLRSGLKMSLNGREIDPWNVDWSRADITRYHVYQPSGDDNALGAVKFLFPNKHAVYLHDTPSKRLFNATTRTFSHGCVRVRNPVRLAELVLAADKNWSGKAVRDLVEDGPEDNAVKLDTKIPVHITYFTASVDAEGRVSSFPDVYGHERRISLAIDGRADQIAKLNPAPLEIPRSGVEANTSEAAKLQRKRRIVAASAEAQPAFDAPAGLGFSPPTAQKKSSGGSQRRFRGDSPNDVVMRALGGF
ncbi:MAG: L,D-transpeptidase family protein [Hyphomicrobiaceae bacterium]